MKNMTRNLRFKSLGPWLLALSLLGLAACAAAPQQEIGATPAAADVGIGQEDETVSLPEPIDEEVLYRVLAGEYLGSEGEIAAAVDEYLEAALISEDPEIARRAVRIAVAAESWQQAAMAADRWALLAPDSVPAHEAAASAMLRVGNYFDAEYQLIAILDLLEDSADSWVLVSRILAQTGDFEDTDKVLERLQSERPEADSSDVYLARSQLAASARDVRRAFEYGRRAVERSPDRPDLLAWTGRLALNLGLRDTGIEYVRRAWELDPDNHDLALGYADLIAREGDEDGARAVMAGMIQTPDVTLSRILFEIAAKNRAEAERLFNDLADMSWPDESEKAFYQAQSAEALGMSRQAIAYYERVVEGDRALASALRRAELIALDGDLETARAELARMRSQGDARTVEQAWLTEARILRESGDRDTAYEVLGEAVMQRPESLGLLYSRALLAAELGRIDDAERDLRTIITAQPENAAALNALGYTLADQTDRLEEAENLVRQAYMLQPEEPSIIDSMGWVSFRLGRLEQAESFLRRAWQIDRNPEIGAHLGEVLWVRDKKEAAMNVWREAAGVDEENPVLVETLERLDITL